VLWKNGPSDLHHSVSPVRPFAVEIQNILACTKEKRSFNKIIQDPQTKTHETPAGQMANIMKKLRIVQRMAISIYYIFESLHTVCNSYMQSSSEKMVGDT